MQSLAKTRIAVCWFYLSCEGMASTLASTKRSSTVHQKMYDSKSVTDDGWLRLYLKGQTNG